MKTCYLIVPAFSDQAGQCRIVSRKHEVAHPDPLGHYRRFPEQWAEAGLMNSQGKLVCLEAPPAVVQEFTDCEPLMAGLTVYEEQTEKEAPIASEQSASYDRQRIAMELDRTALNDSFYGDALRLAKDIPGLTDEERATLERWATGAQVSSDHMELQAIAIKIRLPEQDREFNPTPYPRERA